MGDIVSSILSNYRAAPVGVRVNIARLLTSGRLAHTGKLLILPVDQGVEHGPIRSFSYNEDAYDPLYHPNLALEAGLSAYAAPIGMIELAADLYAHRLPLILKLNNSNLLHPKELNGEYQAITASVKDAVRLGCCAVGFTIYPGSPQGLYMMEEAKEIICEANSYGLPSVIWSYPRGAGIEDGYETSIDVISYAVHIAALMGAHIIKTKIPSSHVMDKKVNINFDLHDMSLRIRQIMKCAFSSKRIVLFSGGASKDISNIKDEILAIKKGGGSGSIIGRNTFQRPRKEAVEMLNSIIALYGSYGDVNYL
ncbi:Fructose-bisphosphate aldolase class 1 [Candidatus Cyrtobacter comes]|uniref:fructose-bisphosphate aldolase n=1 Tax=Candidatus Cyrtobacter comes TaxID=675776 RepID=A0ABU5L6B6_9RICK|nr:class I fructose-bisphosphate aldolase [Candidatus Cyrtobacter comes]MDZ5761672.1 Fructose-bisphosphate aldolase class 1 [Candidatus Cyrtobacter comes]